MRGIVIALCLMAQVACGQATVSATAKVFYTTTNTAQSYWADGNFYYRCGDTTYSNTTATAFSNTHYSMIGGNTYIGGIATHTISDYRDYNRPLIVSEITDLKDRPWSVQATGMVLRTCVAMTNDTGSVLANGAIVRDISGNGNNGTASNGVVVASPARQWKKPYRASVADVKSYDMSLIADKSGSGNTAINWGDDPIYDQDGWRKEFLGVAGSTIQTPLVTGLRATSIYQFKLPYFDAGIEHAFGCADSYRWYFAPSHSSFPGKMLFGMGSSYGVIDQSELPTNTLTQVALVVDYSNAYAYIQDTIVTQFTIIHAARCNYPILIGGGRTGLSLSNYYCNSTGYRFLHYTNALTLDQISNVWHGIEIPPYAVADYTMEPVQQ